MDPIQSAAHWTLSYQSHLCLQHVWGIILICTSRFWRTKSWGKKHLAPHERVLEEINVCIDEYEHSWLFPEVPELRFSSRRDAVIPNPEFTSAARAAVAESPQISLRWFQQHHCHPGGRRSWRGELQTPGSTGKLHFSPWHTQESGESQRGGIKGGYNWKGHFPAQILAFTEQIGAEAERCWRISTTAVWKLEGEHCRFFFFQSKWKSL